MDPHVQMVVGAAAAILGRSDRWVCYLAPVHTALVHDGRPHGQLDRTGLVDITRPSLGQVVLAGTFHCNFLVFPESNRWNLEWLFSQKEKVKPERQVA